MRRVTLLLVCFCVSPAWADPNTLLYEGFDYPDGTPLAPPGDTNENPLGAMHQASGYHWHLAGGSATPVPLAVQGNVWFDNGMPAPTGNSVFLTNLVSGATANRLRIPNVVEPQTTMYWSGYLRVDDVDNLAGAPNSGTNEGGAIIAGFNNTYGAQTNAPTVFGALLAIKRGSANPESPRFDQYYIGTSTTSQGNDCGPAANYRCGSRHFADYDPQLDPAVNPLADGSDLPAVYSQSAITQWGPRPMNDAVPIAEGETVFLVASYEVVDGIRNDISKLWINPDPESFGTGMEPTPNVTAVTNPITNAEDPTVQSNWTANDMNINTGLDLPHVPVRSFFFRNSGTSQAAAYFDELRVGTTWASVTGGAIVPPGVTGDYNADGKVDAADYVVWRKNEGTSNPLPNDPTGGTIGMAQYDQWVDNFGAMAPGGGSTSLTAVPEPGSLLLAALAVVGSAAISARRRRDR